MLSVYALVLHQMKSCEFLHAFGFLGGKQYTTKTNHLHTPHSGEMPMKIRPLKRPSVKMQHNITIEMMTHGIAIRSFFLYE